MIVELILNERKLSIRILDGQTILHINLLDYLVNNQIKLDNIAINGKPVAWRPKTKYTVLMS